MVSMLIVQKTSLGLCSLTSPFQLKYFKVSTKNNWIWSQKSSNILSPFQVPRLPASTILSHIQMSLIIDAYIIFQECVDMYRSPVLLYREVLRLEDINENVFGYGMHN